MRNAENIREIAQMHIENVVERRSIREVEVNAIVKVNIFLPERKKENGKRVYMIARFI